MWLVRRFQGSTKVPRESISDTFQSRLQGLYGQNNSAKEENDFMKLAKDWNESASKDQERDLGLQGEAIYVEGKRRR